MELPGAAAVMIVPNAVLFPQAFLPLYIFEPRYQKMLRDALNTHRMFCLAMLKPGAKRETPMPVAGLGLIRAAVDHPDGTSHLVLHGVIRAELGEVVSYKPYRYQRIRPLETATDNTVVVDALIAKVRDLVGERIALGFPNPFAAPGKGGKKKNAVHARDVLSFLEQLDNPDQVADLVTSQLLPRADERQVILQTVQLEERLRHLIHFLSAEIERHRAGGGDKKT